MIINALIVDLEKSKLCCTIFGIPSSPAGYADDLATTMVSKGRVHKVQKIVYDYGTKWWFRFNASKSAVLVFSESRKYHEKIFC